MAKLDFTKTATDTAASVGTGVAVGEVVGSVAEVSGTVGELVGIAGAAGAGAAIGAAAGPVGAMVGLFIAAVTAALKGVTSPEEWRRLLKTARQGTPFMKAFVLQFTPQDGRVPGAQGSGLSCLNVKGAFAVCEGPLSIASIRDKAGEKGVDYIDSAIYQTMIATDAAAYPAGTETPEEARAALALWRQYPESLRGWVSGSLQIMKDGQASDELRQVAGWMWPQKIAEAAGEPGLFSDPTWNSAFIAGKAEIPTREQFVAAHPELVVQSYGWWIVGGVVLASAVGLGYLYTRKQKPLALNYAQAQQGIGMPGLSEFHRVLHQGVLDEDLEYPRKSTRGMLYFDKAFNDARLLGIEPTELAASGRFFGAEVEPIRIEVHPNDDGAGIFLADGKKKYTAAKRAGATAILADVVLYDRNGDVVKKRRAVVRIP